MSLINVVLYCLATWRISSLFVEEHGPNDIFLKFRKKIGIDFYKEVPARFIPEVFMCIWCFSIWVGFIFLILDYHTEIAPYIALPFAVSAGAIWFDSAVNKG